MRRFRLALVLLAVLAVAVPAATLASDKSGDQPAPVMDKASLVAMGNAFSAVAKEASPAVVFITVEKSVAMGPFQGHPSLEGSPFNDFFERFFGDQVPKETLPEQRQIMTGQGSGCIVSSDGVVLTNSHVVGGADKITVKLQDGREFKGTVAGSDPATDLAVVKIDARDLPVLRLGSSESLEVGEWVLAVGNPFGLSHTVTAGIISATGRGTAGITDYGDFIQTDAAINMGNSGGPLLNLEGEVVGINTAIVSRTGGYAGVGFAIPIDLAKHIKNQLVATGSVTRGYLGVFIQELTPALAEKFDLKEVSKGVLVAQVNSDSPAEKAGLKQGDVIVSMDGKRVDDVTRFRNAVAMKDPGTEIELAVLRDGKERDVSVELGKMPAQIAEAGARSGVLEKMGLSLQDLTPALADRFGYKAEEGVLVTEVTRGSMAEQAGIKSGDLIKAVNRQPVRSVADVQKVLSESGDKDSVMLLVSDGRGSRFVILEMGE